MSWTKADTARAQTAVTWVLRAARKAAKSAGPPESRAYEAKRAEVDALLVKHRDEMVCDWLRANATNKHRDGRAYTRLADKIEAEDWPEHVDPPRMLPLVIEAEPEPPKPVARPLIDRAAYDAQVRRAAEGQIARAIADTIERGEVTVYNAQPATVMGFPGLEWSDVDGCVSWRVWLVPVAAELGPPSMNWLRATSTRPNTWPVRGELFVRSVWTTALGRVEARALELPRVLDLRGLPTTHGAVTSNYLDPLSQTLASIDRGLVLLVEDASWVIERVLNR